MNDDSPRRKLAPRPLAPRTAPRAIAPAARSTWRLPTVAALASAMAVASATSEAAAGETPWFDDAGPDANGGGGVIVTGSVVVGPNGVSATVSVSQGPGAAADAGAAEDADALDPDADPDADAGPVYCDPSLDDHMLGGVPMTAIPRVHGTGCGCTGGDGENDEPAMAVAVMAALMLLLRRR